MFLGVKHNDANFNSFECSHNLTESTALFVDVSVRHEKLTISFRPGMP
jgi:hypothetical protein